MAIGPVNVPGTAGSDIKTITADITEAKENADTALTKANSAYDLAVKNEAAIKELSKAAAGASVPFQNGTLTYTGSELTPTWIGYDSNKLTIGGTTKATDAGVYTATFTPKEGYSWAGGATDAASVQWSIQKAAGSLSLSKSSATLNASALTTTVTVTRAGNGAITATSSNASIATVNVSGTTLTLTAKAKGAVTVTVNVAADTNHNAPESKTINITVDVPSETLTDNTPANIQAAAKNGTAANYWSIGDKIAIKLNGVVGRYTFSNETYYAVILGFNHNSSIEGSNTIHFQFGKDSSGDDIAFCDDAYDEDITTGTGFIINTTNTNTGGWNGSYMRKNICPAFLNAMPSEWQNVITPCTKYSDNTGGGNDTASFVTATSDKIWLLSEFEVWGKKNYANSAEQNYQKQYDYYRNGNSKAKGKHLEKNTACIWLLRSVSASTTVHICAVNKISMGITASNRSDGFAPGFKVG